MPSHVTPLEVLAVGLAYGVIVGGALGLLAFVFGRR